MMDMVFIPERLKGIREERNLSKAAAARLLNLSKMGYLRYETGDRTPSYQTIVFMAQKLGLWNISFQKQMILNYSRLSKI